MYEEEVRASFEAQAYRMAEVINESSIARHMRACQDAARNAIQAGKPPERIMAPLAAIPHLMFDPVLRIDFTHTGLPVSNAKPEDFMPPPRPTIDAVLGTKIPQSADKYYPAPGTRPSAGDKYEREGKRYEFRAPFFGLGGYWQEV